MTTDSHSAMAAELADERQQSARLREAIQEALYAVVATVEFYENATPRMAGEVPLGAAKAILMRALAGAEPQPSRGWTFALEDRPEWHSIPVGVIRAADEDVLFVQFYPEWQDHREAVALVLAAANGGRADV